MIYFLLLSLLSGIIELGSVYIGIKHNSPIPMLMLLPFWYQMGNLLMGYLSKKKNKSIITAGICIISSFINIVAWNYLTLVVQLISCSFCIQVAREDYKKSCPAWLKRSFRILGFALSPIMIYHYGQFIFLISSFLCLYLFIGEQRTSSLCEKKTSKESGLSWVMIFHQMHYFVYTYIMPLYVFSITNNYIVSSISFALTWVVYLMPQTIVEKSNNINYKKVFFAGHAFLAICLFMMSRFSCLGQDWGVLLFWLLTGLGGGTVFCIRHLSFRYEQINMDLSENIGHVMGPIVALLVSYCFAGKELTYLTFFSFVFVLVALCIGVVIQREEWVFYE